jgi:hypothetical protein
MPLLPAVVEGDVGSIKARRPPPRAGGLAKAWRRPIRRRPLVLTERSPACVLPRVTATRRRRGRRRRTGVLSCAFPLRTPRRGARPFCIAVTLALLPAMLFLFSVQLLSEVLFAGTGVSPIESFERALAVGVPVPLHGHEDGGTRTGDGI